ncbi:S-adenosyl-L-methionine-dependent methyltransferase [Achaetomium macrosporum]|uniref:S-adenosyl-L-methionine-dependent methyltransferase n=1 Tax=Achaetomium macrosporum TaxID=79813 RepID=A0AAN7HEJ9_9PEZI|nr:S-adenosyl-L-methionine-dependent methyltransferase [Achaetomium macrosporum]
MTDKEPESNSPAPASEKREASATAAPVQHSESPASTPAPAPGPVQTEPTATTNESPAPPQAETAAVTASATALPPEHWTEAPAGESEDDGDSALGEDALSSTASLSSSILNYRTIHGRTFHSEIGNATYWGTNDERHSESLDVLHHLFTLCLDGEIYAAPVKDPKKALDIGTGTGIWAIDFADMWPACEVIGTDISPIQPTWVPPNVKFEIDDCTQPWTFEPDSFDYVHIRYLQGCIADWYAFFREAYKALAPGGWLESHEASPNVFSDDDTLPPKSAIAQWGPLFVDGGKAIGRSFTIVDEDIQRKAMEEAGFVDIQEKLIKVPSGGWPADPKQREIGIFAQHAIETDVEGFILFMTTVLGWSREQVTVYIAHLRRELRSLKHHVCYWQKVVWGRKPETA